MAEFDMVEQILVRLDVKDLIRCKTVCKAWQSLISSPPFVKAHLNRCCMNDRNNPQLGYRRICASFIDRDECDSFYCNETLIVGSCNGLVCVSPRDVDFVVTNPSTREYKKLPTVPYPKIAWIRQRVECLGFGYDSSTDDYKVIAGFMKNRNEKTTLFYVFTLKSNTWQVIGQVEYKGDVSKSGILCGGALHWIMANKDEEKVIISLDLLTQEFKQVPLPFNKCDYFHRLGVIEELCLCIYSYPTPFTSKKWVMRNNNWQLYDNIDHCQSKYDIVHLLDKDEDEDEDEVDSQNTTYSLDEVRHVPSNGDYMWNSIFVNSLVSPHVNNNNNRQERNSKGRKVTRVLKAVTRKTKIMKRSCKHKRPL